MRNFEIDSFLQRDVKNYSEAVFLLQKYAGNTRAAFYSKANPKYYLDQVLAILSRLAHSTIAKPDAPADVQPRLIVPEKRKYPEAIIRSKAKLHELWVALDKYHRTLVAMGDGNSDELCKARVALMAERQPYIEAFEELYIYQQHYFAEGFVRPELEQLLSRLDGEIDAKAEQPNDYSQLDDLALVKKRNSVRSQIAKWQNMLRFQQKTPAAQLNPMPEGPKRSKIMADIKHRQLDLALLNEMIKERGL